MSKAVVEGFSGGLGSLIALATTYPLKTIYTLQAISSAKARGETLARIPDSSPFQALARSLSGLYAGFGPAALETVTSSAVYFYLYSLLRQWVVAARRRRQAGDNGGGRPEDIGVLASLIVAALAGAGNTLVTTPAQVVTTQMQALSKQQQQQRQQRQDLGLQASGDADISAWGVTRQLYGEGGVVAFWKGLLPSLVLVVNPALQYMLFEWMVARLLRRKAVRAAGPQPLQQHSAKLRLGPGETFLAGALAKIGATIFTYPMIVVKSRLQATNKDTHADLQYTSTWDAIQRIFKDEGASGFWNGIETKILQTALNAALMLMIKDQVYQGTEAALKVAATLPSRQAELRASLAQHQAVLLAATSIRS